MPTRRIALAAVIGTLVLGVLPGAAGSARASASHGIASSLARPAIEWSEDKPSALAVTRTGTKVFVTGFSVGLGTPFDYATVAYDAAGGRRLWVARYDGPANGGDVPYGIAVSRDGSRVFVTGSSDGGARAGKDFATVAYAAGTGRRLWVARYDGPAGGDDEAFSVAVSPDSRRVFVTGRSAPFADATVSYDAATGARLWAVRSDVGGSVAVSPDGTRVFVTGEDFDAVAYDAASGATLWVGRYAGPGLDYEQTLIAVTPDGATVFVTGTSAEYEAIGDVAAPRDYATVAYDTATGRRLWVARYVPGDAHARGLAVSPDGTRVFVTGFDGEAAATVAYRAATGAELWVARAARAPQGAESVAVSGDGTKLFATGGRGSIAYDAATGARLWVAHDAVPAGPASGATMAVSPDQTRLFATAFWFRAQTGLDYVTLALDSKTGSPLWRAWYDGSCVVPRVRGLALRAAMTRIRSANCTPGKVTRASSGVARGRVVSQRPRPGTQLPANARVTLVVSRGANPKQDRSPPRRHAP